MGRTWCHECGWISRRGDLSRLTPGDACPGCGAAVNAFTASDRARAEGEAAGSIFRFKEILRDDPGASLSRGELRDVLRRFERLAALLTP